MNYIISVFIFIPSLAPGKIVPLQPVASFDPDSLKSSIPVFHETDVCITL